MRGSSVCLLIAVGLSCCYLGLTASIGQQGALDNRDKRAGEVIFFENEQKKSMMKKRSGSGWPRYGGGSPAGSSNVDKVADGSGEEMEKSGVAEKPEREDEDEKRLQMEWQLLSQDQQLAKELEDWAFSEAVDYIVERLIKEAIQEEILDPDTLDRFTNPTQSTIPLETEKYAEGTTLPPAIAPPSSNNKADDLALLIKGIKEKSTPSEEPKRSWVDKMKEFQEDGGEKLEENVEMLPSEDGPPNEQEKYGKGYEDARRLFDEDTIGDDTGGDDVAESITEELSMLDDEGKAALLRYYLANLKIMEAKLKGKVDELEDSPAADQDMPDVSGQAMESHGRRKRSIVDEEDWFEDKQRPSPGNRGVWFTDEEAAELREILVGLAEEKLQMEEKLIGMKESGMSELSYSDEPVSRDEQLNNLAAGLNQESSKYGSQYPKYPEYPSKRRYTYYPYYFQKRK